MSTLTARGILLAVGPVVLYLALHAAAGAIGSPLPPRWLWDVALATLAAGLGVAGYGYERRDRARGGSYRDNVTPPPPASGPGTLEVLDK